MAQELYQRGLRVPVLQAPTIQRVDVSSGLMAAADARQEVEQIGQAMLEAADMAKKQADIARATEAAQEENDKLPYDQKLDHWMRSQEAIRTNHLSSGLPRTLKALTPQIEREFATIRSRVKGEVFEGAAAHAIAEADETTRINVGRATNARDEVERRVAIEGIHTANRTLVGAGFVREDKARARTASALEEVDLVRAKRAIKDNPWSALSDFEKNPTKYAHVGALRIESLKDEAGREVRSREAQQRAEQRAQRAEQREINRDRLEAEKKLTATVSALNRVGAGDLFDPRSADDRKAIDLAWETRAETLTPEQTVPEMVRYSAQVGMVPERGKMLIRGLLRSSRDADVLQGADLVGRLRSQNAELMNDFAKEDVRLAESVLAQTEGGVPAQDALRRYREGQQISDPVRDVRKTQFGEALKLEGKSGANALRTAVGGDGSWIGWVSDADVPPEAEEEFNRLRADEFIKTGSMDAATRFAGENIKRVYGVSEMSGGRAVTKYAPEQWYGRRELSVTDNAAWIRDQARVDAGTVMGGAAPEGDVQLTPARRVGADGRPAYVITITKPDGQRVVPMKNGKPLLFVPSFESSPAKKKLEDDLKAQIDDARTEKSEAVKGFKARGGTLPGDFGL